MKKLFIILTALSLIAGMGIMKAEAALTDSILVTVTMQNISVIITAGDTIALGIMAPEVISNAQSCTAKNDGNINEKLEIAVSNSANWSAGSSAAANTFVMTLDETTALSNTKATLASSVAPNGTKDFELTLTMPVSSSVFTEQTITVTVSASAA